MDTAKAPNAEHQRGSIWLGLLPYTGVLLFLFQLPFILASSDTLSDIKIQVLGSAVAYLIGWTSLGSGIIHLFFSRRIAASIGFESNQFQQEVAFANLAMGMTALVVSSLEPQYWLSIILVSSLYRFGCGYVHIRDIVARGNYAINNTGILALNFVVPLMLLVGYWAWIP